METLVDNRLNMRCAIYSRYSSDNQREASIHDQVRKCREYALSKQWVVLEEHIYADEAISGSGIDRPALTRLLQVSRSHARPFDAILVDDTSRLSRNLSDALRMTDELAFIGVRVIAVSQGIDSADEQAPVMFTVHGLIDQFYIRELAKKTHRGLEGLALKGLHTGGRVFGYETVDAGEGRKRLQIYEPEAIIVRRIFQLRAKGMPLKKIARVLNEERIPSPRPGTRKKYNSWCYTGIREMLRRELYVGRIVWNKRKYVKNPGTNKRVSRPRPHSEWRFAECRKLRIVSEQLWNAVQEKNQHTMALYSEGAKKGLASRSQTSAYLLSGILKCSLCGANMVIISGRGGRWARYGCTQHWNRGNCKNDLTLSREVAEQTLLNELQEFLDRPAGLDYVLGEVSDFLQRSTDSGASRVNQLNARKEQIEEELERLTLAIRQGVPARTLKTAITEAEAERKTIEGELKQLKPINIHERITHLRKFVEQQIASLPSLLRVDPHAAKWEFQKHLRELWLTPVRDAEGRRFYIGVGEWLIEDDGLSSLWLSRRACAEESDEKLPRRHKELLRNQQDRTHDARFELENSNATGAWLNCGVRSIAGGGFEPPTFGL
jgi:site-specific DNA recombinase